MSEEHWKVGIVGGTGMLGSAIAQAILASGALRPDSLWISNRSGKAKGFGSVPPSNVTGVNQALADASDVILLSVPPAMAHEIEINAEGKLVMSVVAGVSLDELKEITGTSRVVRAMSSPAAKHGLAYSPWCASVEATTTDRERASIVFGACGLADEVESEAHVEFFTALTGPVPGFVAFFAEAMVDYAIAGGIAPNIADRAIRQLFLAAGQMMSEGSMTPADHVKFAVDYAGTTAAGLNAMKRLPISAEIAEGLDAAVAKTRVIG